MFLVAGYESAYASGSPGVWAHKWNICSGAEGVTIPETDGISSLLCSNGYSRFGELQGDHDATIGIISHELGHALGFKDNSITGHMMNHTWNRGGYGKRKLERNDM